MAIYTRGPVTECFAASITELTHPQSEFGTIVTPTAGALWAEIELLHAFIEATVNTDPGSFIIQKTLEAVSNDRWIDVAEFTVTDALPETEALSATEAAGVSSIAVASTTNLLSRQTIFIQDASVVLDSEWHKIDRIVSNTSVELVNGLRVGKDASDAMFNAAETFPYTLDLSGVVRWRVIYAMNEEGTGANVAIAGKFIEVRSIG